MKRSVRNGLAIAGMAGGMWFLGSAVASADQVADAANGTDQTAASQSAGSGDAESAAGNINSSDADATNVQVTEVETEVEGGDGGTNTASVNTGVISGGPADFVIVNEADTPPAPPVHEVNVDTGDVAVEQQANGGDVNNSGNVKVSGHGDQTATATNTVTQTATASSEGDEEDKGKGKHKGRGGDDSESAAGNINHSDADAENVSVIEVETDIEGGDGGSNYADINTGIIGNTFYCPEGSTCYFNFTTGSVTVVQHANGGDVNGSGNVNVGGHDDKDKAKGDRDKDRDRDYGRDKDRDCPKEQAKPTVKPAAAPVTYRAPVNAYAQPAGQLAYTGSDVSLPLTVGLLALGAGAALTAAGRRRETQSV